MTPEQLKLLLKARSICCQRNYDRIYRRLRHETQPTACTTSSGLGNVGKPNL